MSYHATMQAFIKVQQSSIVRMAGAQKMLLPGQLGLLAERLMDEGWSRPSAYRLARAALDVMGFGETRGRGQKRKRSD